MSHAAVPSYLTKRLLLSFPVMIQNVFGAIFPVEKNLRGKLDGAKASTDRANVPRKRRPRQTSRRLYNSPEMDHIKETMKSAGEMMQTLGGVGTVAVLALAAILAIFWLVFPFMVHNQLHRLEKQLKQANETLESAIYYLSRMEENTKPRADRGPKAGTEAKENI